MESASVRTKKHASERRASAVLLALTAVLGSWLPEERGRQSAGRRGTSPAGSGADSAFGQDSRYDGVLSILKSRHSATINPQVEGQITRIFVKSGEHVKAGLRSCKSIH